MEFKSVFLDNEHCALCGCRRLQIKEETGTPRNSSEDKTLGQFCFELRVFWSYYYGGTGAGEVKGSSRKLQSLSVCLECGPLIRAALQRKDNIVRVEAKVRKLESKLLKELNELKRHLDLFLREMRKIGGLIEAEAPEAYQQDGEDLLAVIQHVLQHIEKGRKEDTHPLQKSTLKRNDSQMDKLSGGMKENEVKVEVICEPELDDNPLEDGDWHSDDPVDQDRDEQDWKPDSCSDPDNSEAENNYFEDEDSSEDFRPKENPGFKTGRNKAKSSRSTSKIDKIDLSGLSEFKKGVIQRALGRPGRIAKGRAQYAKQKRKDKLFVEDPSESEQYCMQYSQEHDCLSVKDIRIKIVEDPPSLECSQCEFKVDGYPEKPFHLDRLMSEHVKSRHLHLFQCPQCGKDHVNYTRYKYHMNEHRNLYTCDICSKPLSKLHLKAHRWTHMSAEEVEEAKRKGVKDPRQKPVALSDKGFQCAACGKSFRLKGQLTAHEKCHERKMVMCPTCGKQVAEQYYKSSHHKICGQSGADAGRPPVQCPHCPKTFATPARLKTHIKRNHTAEGKEIRFTCQVCSKGFKFKSGLEEHVASIHSDVRRFECSKGCGTTFRQRTSWTRHNKSCDGHGTKPGRKGPGWKNK